MIVNNLDFANVTILPLKDNSPLIVNPNTVESFQIALKYTLNGLELNFLKMPKSIISNGFQSFLRSPFLSRLEYTSKRLPGGLFRSSNFSTAFKISNLFKAFRVISEGIFLESRPFIPLNKSAVA